MGAFKDLTGKRFGSLTVVERVGSHPTQGAVWRCLCDCGRERYARSNELNRSHKCRSCIDCAKSTNIRAHIKHGKSRSEVYFRWQSMMQRCYNSNLEIYQYYGAKGVTVCEEWKDVANFLSWAEGKYRKGLSLDRVNVLGNYEPNNCRFITRSENSKGLRRWQAENLVSTA